MRANDFAKAKIHAQFVKAKGDLLAIRPEFRDCFKGYRADMDTQEALKCLEEFILCATDCRREATPKPQRSPEGAGG
jgi:hypothetical protein